MPNIPRKLMQVGALMDLRIQMQKLSVSRITNELIIVVRRSKQTWVRQNPEKVHISICNLTIDSIRNSGLMRNPVISNQRYVVLSPF